MTKIFIAAIPKSASTSLFFRIVRSVPTERTDIPPLGLFEPKSFAAENLRASVTKRFGIDLSETEVEGLQIVAKVLLTGDIDLESFTPFEKKILLIRDPRDQLLSTFLYAFHSAQFVHDRSALQEMLALLMQKERSPRTISFCDFLEHFDSVNGGSLRATVAGWRQASIDYHKRFPESFVLLYRHYVSGTIEPLEGFLGFSLVPSNDVPRELSRVFRSGRRGEWRHWFLPKDIDELRPEMQEYAEYFSLDLAWAPTSEPFIDPSGCSQYVVRLLEQRGIMV